MLLGSFTAWVQQIIKTFLVSSLLSGIVLQLLQRAISC